MEQKTPPDPMTSSDWAFCHEAEITITFARNSLISNVSLNSLITGLRKDLNPEQAAQAVEMAQLQIEARKKFSSPNGMRFTRKGLEQSTSETVARYKAGLIGDGILVADACCGIGGDSMALGENRPIVAIEIDWTMARIARHNLDHAKCGNAQVVQADFCNFDFAGFDFIHVDPDRRSGKSRTTQPEFAQPGWNSILERLGNRFAAVKMAPAAILDEYSNRVHRHWIGTGRECREQLVWINSPLFDAGGKTATVVDGNGSGISFTCATQDQPGLNAAPVCGDYLYEPHSAVFAAGLDGDLALQLNLERLSSDSPYLTGHKPVFSSLIQGFRILHIDSLDRKRMVAAFRKMDVGRIEWKQRGVEPSTFNSVLKMQGSGSNPVTVVLFRVDHRLNFAICRRI